MIRPSMRRPIPPRNAVPQRATGNWKSLLGAIAICQGAGIIGLLLGNPGGNQQWYRQLNRPRFAPPSFVFGPVWTLLYLMMGLSLHRIWQERDRQAAARPALRWFGLQLFLNALWTPVFFGMRSLGGGLAICLALVPAIGATIFSARRVSRPAAWLLAPYWAWTAFATVLNAAIVQLNPGRAW